MENIYIYEIPEDTYGIVIASDPITAEQKVRDAYQKHDTGYDKSWQVIIKNKEEGGVWFADSPDVIEVFG